jgi:hypothetical protein
MVFLPKCQALGINNRCYNIPCGKSEDLPHNPFISYPYSLSFISSSNNNNGISHHQVGFGQDAQLWHLKTFDL